MFTRTHASANSRTRTFATTITQLRERQFSFFFPASHVIFTIFGLFYIMCSTCGLYYGILLLNQIVFHFECKKMLSKWSYWTDAMLTMHAQISIMFWVFQRTYINILLLLRAQPEWDPYNFSFFSYFTERRAWFRE